MTANHAVIALMRYTFSVFEATGSFKATPQPPADPRYAAALAKQRADDATRTT